MLISLLILLNGLVTCYNDSTGKVLMCVFKNDGANSYASTNKKFMYPYLCTHILYYSAKIDLQSLYLNASTTHDLLGGFDNYNQVQGLRLVNPDLKVILTSVNLFDGEEHDSAFEMASDSPQKAIDFASNVLTFLAKYDFDGYNIYWQNPSTPQRHTLLLQNLNAALQKYNKYLLVTTISIYKKYEHTQVNRFSDYVLVENYKYNKYNSSVNHPFPLYFKDLPDNSINDTMTFLINNDIQPEKLVMAILTYALMKKCSSEYPNNGAVCDYPKTPMYFKTPYYSYCKTPYSEQSDPELHSTFAFGGTYYIGIENEYSLAKKVGYIYEKQMAGVYVESLDMDDFRGDCNMGPYPITGILHDQLRIYPQIDWTEVALRSSHLNKMAPIIILATFLRLLWF